MLTSTWYRLSEHLQHQVVSPGYLKFPFPSFFILPLCIEKHQVLVKKNRSEYSSSSWGCTSLMTSGRTEQSSRNCISFCGSPEKRTPEIIRWETGDSTFRQSRRHFYLVEENWGHWRRTCFGVSTIVSSLQGGKEQKPWGFWGDQCPEYWLQGYWLARKSSWILGLATSYGLLPALVRMLYGELRERKVGCRYCSDGRK